MRPIVLPPDPRTPTLVTERLELVPATLGLTRAACDGAQALGTALGALRLGGRAGARGPRLFVGGRRQVVAHTLPELVPSIGVLSKCGFRFVGAGAEPGVIRFELTRSEYEARQGSGA